GGFAVVGSGGAINSTGVLGTTSGGGPAVHAVAGTNSRALIAETDGTNQAFWSHIESDTNTKDSIRAETKGTGSGIYATSAKGAGGKFGGKTANIQLVPSTASSHPASGSAGQLFVDKANRLWYCRGGSNWAQLA